MFLSFQLVSADDPWRGRHQAGGILGQGGSEVESAVGSKLALTRAPTLCWRGHSYLDGVEMGSDAGLTDEGLGHRGFGQSKIVVARRADDAFRADDVPRRGHVR